ncbi:hypothetical protein FPANT_10297 [Fusarium pseudoanthophilum]|uniref:Uncharacterized protein n=1 Tax=Fusarium pseudoanthophilum TaxID=48495 RepID=A0A8H5KNS5_9HYPO|nr:hypothetical protein FPANT_10297 [Fusarium pseudoanthophilum]
MDWSPSKSPRPTKEFPRLCNGYYDAEDHSCDTCDDDNVVCYPGNERMGDLLHRLIKHIKANAHLSKTAYESDAKTIRLRKKANRALASDFDAHDLAYPEDRRAEQQDAIAINTLACLIDISNSQRIQAQCALVSIGLSSHFSSQMPARCGPEKMPAECLGELSSDSEEDGQN